MRITHCSLRRSSSRSSVLRSRNKGKSTASSPTAAAAWFRAPPSRRSRSQTGLSRDAVTGANGRYNFPSMRPTIYEITAALTGFKTVRRTGVELQANQALTVNITLELGELGETILVAGNAAQVDITTGHDQRGRRSCAHRRAAAERPRRGEADDAGRGHDHRLDQHGDRASRFRAAFACAPTDRKRKTSRSVSTARATTIRTSRKTRRSRSRKRCRSSRFRRATTARHPAIRPAPSSTPSRALERTASMAAASGTCAT